MKTCTKCKKEKELWEFSFKNKEKGTLQPICKECKRKVDNDNYKSNSKRRESVKESTKNNKEILKNWLTEYKKTCVCSKCSDNRFYVLDFHHIDPLEKSFNISEKVKEGCSIITLQKEIEKCVVLCANCHRELHYLSLPINN